VTSSSNGTTKSSKGKREATHSNIGIKEVLCACKPSNKRAGIKEDSSWEKLPGTTHHHKQTRHRVFKEREEYGKQ
jgi:hypothetical protein